MNVLALASGRAHARITRSMIVARYLDLKSCGSCLYKDDMSTEAQA